MKQENIELKIRSIIDKIRPILVNDGGNLEFVKIEDNIVYVDLQGACANCAYASVTLKDGIEQLIINEIPEIIEVRNINDTN